MCCIVVYGERDELLKSFEMVVTSNTVCSYAQDLFLSRLGQTRKYPNEQRNRDPEDMTSSSNQRSCIG